MGGCLGKTSIKKIIKKKERDFVEGEAKKRSISDNWKKKLRRYWRKGRRRILKIKVYIDWCEEEKLIIIRILRCIEHLKLISYSRTKLWTLYFTFYEYLLFKQLPNRYSNCIFKMKLGSIRWYRIGHKDISSWSVCEANNWMLFIQHLCIWMVII